jgi:hypothetical protein
MVSIRTGVALAVIGKNFSYPSGLALPCAK